MSETARQACIHCGKTDDVVRLLKCPICHKRFCEEDQHVISGRPFCSNHCADFFFFADPDAEDDE